MFFLWRNIFFNYSGGSIALKGAILLAEPFKGQGSETTEFYFLAIFDP